MASNFWPSPSPIAHISLYHHFFFCLVCFVLFFYGGKTVCRVAWRLCKNQKRFFSLPGTQLSSQLQLSAETNWTRVQSKWAHTVRTEETFTYTSLTKCKEARTQTEMALPSLFPPCSMTLLFTAAAGLWRCRPTSPRTRPATLAAPSPNHQDGPRLYGNKSNSK